MQNYECNATQKKYITRKAKNSIKTQKTKNNTKHKKSIILLYTKKVQKQKITKNIF